MRDKIVVIGSLNYDIILKAQRLPEKGETMPVDGAGFSAGGKGANQAVQAAKLGLKTYMVGCVGSDVQGRHLLETAKKYGVNTDFIRQVDGASGMGIIHALSDGSVHASIVRGANYDITKEDIDRAEELLNETEIVIFQMEIPEEINDYAIAKAKNCGCKVLMNAAPARAIKHEVMELCDILVVNEVEAAFYLNSEIKSVDDAKAGAAKLSEEYDCDTVITLGEAGAVVCEGGSISFIPSKKVDAIETTGAGDSFIGALGYGHLNGMSLTDASKFATCCSAITVCRIGAQDSMPTLEEATKL